MKARHPGLTALALWLGALFALPAQSEYSPREWTILKTGEVVSTEVMMTRPDGSGTTDVLVKAWIKAPRQEVWEIIRSYNTFAEFFPRVRECRITRQEGETYWVEYHTELLGLMVIYHLKLIGAEKFRRVDFFLDREQPNDVKDTVGFWVLDDAPEGKGTILSYSIFVDSGIPIPQFIARKISKPTWSRWLKTSASAWNQAAPGRSPKEAEEF
jgi:hypothetical protein